MYVAQAMMNVAYMDMATHHLTFIMVYKSAIH